MSENKVNMNEWEWEGVTNTPERQEIADRRFARDQQRRAEREEFLCNFYQKNEERRKKRLEVQSCRYCTGAMAAGVAAYFTGTGGMGWLAWVLGGMAVVLGLISAYGFGKACGMGCR